MAEPGAMACLAPCCRRLLAIAQRLLAIAQRLLTVLLLLFIVLRVLPADPAAPAAEIGATHQQTSLDEALPVQFAIWLGRLVQGDLGHSSHLDRPVAGLLAEALPATVELAILASSIAVLLGVVGGLVLFALQWGGWQGAGGRGTGGRGTGRRGETRAALAETGTMLLMSIPAFLWALLFILVFGVLLAAMPFTGRLDPGLSRPFITGFLLLDTLLVGDPRAFLSAARHMVLPAVALGIGFAPLVMRVLRASLIEAYQADYILQARLRGLSEEQVLLRHALGHAALPTLGLLRAQCGLVLGAALLVEVIFAYPGMGRLLVDAMRNADLSVIQGVGLAYCAVVLSANALIDGLHLLLNPRPRAR